MSFNVAPNDEVKSNQLRHGVPDIYQPYRVLVVVANFEDRQHHVSASHSDKNNPARPTSLFGGSSRDQGIMGCNRLLLIDTFQMARLSQFCARPRYERTVWRQY